MRVGQGHQTAWGAQGEKTGQEPPVILVYWIFCFAFELCAVVLSYSAVAQCCWSELDRRAAPTVKQGGWTWKNSETEASNAKNLILLTVMRASCSKESDYSFADDEKQDDAVERRQGRRRPVVAVGVALGGF